MSQERRRYLEHKFPPICYDSVREVYDMCQDVDLITITTPLESHLEIL
jgi:hypothetical protein